MYHGLLKDSKPRGNILSPTVFEEDSTWSTISPSSVAGFARLCLQRRSNCRKNRSMITFDDGYLNNMFTPFPLLQKYNTLKMVLSPCGSVTAISTPNLPTPTPAMRRSPGRIQGDDGFRSVEVQNHSYNLHSNSQSRNGAKKNKGESLEEYQTTLRNDLGEMQRKMKEYTGFEPTAFTPSLRGDQRGRHWRSSKNWAFRLLLLGEEKVNYVTRDPECLYLLGRYLRAGASGPSPSLNGSSKRRNRKQSHLSCKRRKRHAENYLSPSPAGVQPVCGRRQRGVLHEPGGRRHGSLHSPTGIQYVRNNPSMTLRQAINQSNAGRFDLHPLCTPTRLLRPTRGKCGNRRLLLRRQCAGASGRLKSSLKISKRFIPIRAG